MRSVWRLLEIILVALLFTLLGSIGAAVALAGSCIIAGSVAGTYIIRRYEIENTPGLDVLQGEKTGLGGRMAAILGEAAAACACVVLFPFGYVVGKRSRLTLRPGERPVILCHGYMENRSSLLWLGWRLKRAGWRNVIIPNFRPSSGAIPKFAEKLADVVSWAAERTNAQAVDLVGHSMGGLVVRYYIERLGGAPLVHSAVTIGSPHRGTKMAVLGLFRSAAQFRRDSPFIKELNESAPAPGVRMTSIWSDFDNIVLPPENALLPEPYRNEMVRNLGHVALLFSGRVFDQVRLALSDHEIA